jgi:hypothetical protein
MNISERPPEAADRAAPGSLGWRHHVRRSQD